MEDELFSQQRKVAAIQLIRSLNQKLSILEVLDYYGIEYDEKLDGRYEAICPFHNDHSPSLHIYTENPSGMDSWCCYVCNDNGDCFRFIQGMSDNFQQAVQVAQDLIKKTNSGIRSKKQKELYLKLRKAKKAFLKQYKLGIKYREWLKSFRGGSFYEKACGIVDAIFKQIDAFLQAEEYDKLIRFVDRKERKLLSAKGKKRE